MLFELGMLLCILCYNIIFQPANTKNLVCKLVLDFVSFFLKITNSNLKYEPSPINVAGINIYKLRDQSVN